MTNSLHPLARLRKAFAAALFALTFAGCASQNAGVRQAESLFYEGQYEKSLAIFDAMSESERAQPEVQTARLRVISETQQKLTREARQAADLDRLDDAERIYARLLKIYPHSESSRSDLDRLKTRRQLDQQLADAEDLIKKGESVQADRRIRDVLRVEPKHRKALKLAEMLATSRKSDIEAAPPAPEFKKKISLEFKDVPLKSVFEVIWHASGINFILERDVKTDNKVSIFVRDVTVDEALESVLMAQQLAKKMVSPKTVFIYPKTPQKLTEYQDLVVRNFFLNHAEAKQIQTLLKTVLKTRDIHIDEKRNLLVLRDTQEQIDLADKLIQAQDQPEPEVMLAIDVLEIRRSKLSELGLSLPSQISYGVATPLSLSALNQLGAAGINVGLSGPAGSNTLAAINLQKTDSDANMLANPRIRVRNREKAKIHIGDRLPIVTTTSSSTSSFVGQTVNYLDVGLKLEVEPQVMLDDSVAVKLNLEVSSATQSKVNSGFYDVGTRNTSTMLTIRDGETQVLAGLIRDDERESSSRVPGLGDIPILGRLFASERREKDKTEIILAITPHVLVNLTRPDRTLMEYPAGNDQGGRSYLGTAPLPRAAEAAPRTTATPVPPPFAPSYSTPGPASTPLPAGSAPASAEATPAAPTGNARREVGVMPLIEFETPPGIGSPPPARP